MQTGFTDNSPRRSATEVEYVLDPEDHVACRLFLREKAGLDVRPVVVAPPRWRPWVFCYASAGLLLAAFFLWRVHAPDGLLVMDLLATLGLFFFAVTLWSHGPLQVPSDPRREAQEEVETLRRFGHLKIGRRDRVRMDDGGFTEFNEYREEDKGVAVVERKETRVCWSEVGEIDVAEEHALFHVTDKGYLFVPKRAFEDEPTFLRFVETARALRQSFLHRGRTESTLGPPDGLRLPR